MGVFKKVGEGLSWAYKPAVNVKAWIGWDIVKASSHYLWAVVKSLFIPTKAQHTETFEEALARLNLTESDLKARHTEFFRLFLIYGAIGIAIVAYAFYLFFVLNFLGGILAIVVASLAFGMAFRYHFWVFQIKHRKLGCSVREWWHSELDKTPKAPENSEDKS